MQEQKGGFLARDHGGEILDPVAAILEPARAFPPLEIGDRRLVGNHAFRDPSSKIDPDPPLCSYADSAQDVAGTAWVARACDRADRPLPG